jgi:hypothetical protein
LYMHARQRYLLLVPVSFSLAMMTPLEPPALLLHLLLVLLPGRLPHLLLVLLLQLLLQVHLQQAPLWLLHLQLVLPPVQPHLLRAPLLLEQHPPQVPLRLLHLPGLQVRLQQEPPQGQLRPRARHCQLQELTPQASPQRPCRPPQAHRTLLCRTCRQRRW